MGSTVRGFSHTVVGRLLVKLSALLCAFALWVYADSVAMDTRAVKARVSVVREDGSPFVPGSGLMDLSHEQVEVRLRGPVERLNGIGRGAVACVLEVANDYDGKPLTLSVGGDDIVLPESSGLTVIRVIPDKVSLSARSGSVPAARASA